MPTNVIYKTTATADGGRDGHARTADGSLDVKLSTPKEMGGGGGAGNNPEQLFAAGYSACFLGAMKFVASQGGRCNVLGVAQFGSGNSADVDQQGRCNATAVIQTGRNGSVVTRQSGRGNVSVIIQN